MGEFPSADVHSLYDEWLTRLAEQFAPCRYRLWSYEGEQRELLIRVEQAEDRPHGSPYIGLLFRGVGYMRLPAIWERAQFQCVRPAHKRQWLASLPVPQDTIPMPEIFQLRLNKLEAVIVCETLRVVQAESQFGPSEEVPNP